MLNLIEAVKDQFYDVYRNAKKVFIEDDAFPEGFETMDAAFIRLYGMSRKEAEEIVWMDYGDHSIYLYEFPSKYVFVAICFDVDEIRELSKES